MTARDKTYSCAEHDLTIVVYKPLGNAARLPTSIDIVVSAEDPCLSPYHRDLPLSLSGAVQQPRNHCLRRNAQSIPSHLWRRLFYLKPKAPLLHPHGRSWLRDVMPYIWSRRLHWHLLYSRATLVHFCNGLFLEKCVLESSTRWFFLGS